MLVYPSAPLRSVGLVRLHRTAVLFVARSATPPSWPLSPSDHLTWVAAVAACAVAALVGLYGGSCLPALTPSGVIHLSSAVFPVGNGLDSLCHAGIDGMIHDLPQGLRYTTPLLPTGSIQVNT